MARLNEDDLSEQYLLAELQKSQTGHLKWRYVSYEDLGRTSQEDPLIKSLFEKQIRVINAFELADEDIVDILRGLRQLSNNSQGCKKMLQYLKDGYPMKLKDRSFRQVQLIDFINPEKNSFIVTNQNWYVNSEHSIRTDIMLYVNGVPLVDIECKNPAGIGKSWRNAYKQIKRYEKEMPELFKYVQIGVAADAKVRYFPIVPWEKNTRSHEWKEEGLDPNDSVVRMLAPERLIDLIKFYLFSATYARKETKIIARYMQFRAVDKLVSRVSDTIQGKDDKDRGLIWHWQGSGKTFEMIFAANKLYHLSSMDNPTIFFVVDRRDLEEQLYEECAALDMPQPEQIASIEQLRTAIAHDNFRGRRGMLITLVHKFRQEELQQLHKEIKKQSESKETIMTRRNVVTLIDEGHRTQYGRLAKQMKSLFKNGFFFAFTGTPLNKKNRDTYLEFSYPEDDEQYLDKYFITDSINDGFTVKIVYQPRLESQVQLKREQLEAFLSVEEEDIPEDYREDVKDETRKKLNVVRTILENDERIKKISVDVSEHFKDNINEKFKSMVVAVSRKACVKYKRELDKLLPPEWSEVVMSYNPGEEDSDIEKYREELLNRYGGMEINDINKKIVQNFKQSQNPRLLIVTKMLLTGFDAPQLQTMYLDQPLKEHRLLQAIARTNRPYEDSKEAGLVLDYVGVLKHLKDALQTYEEEDWKGVASPLEEIKQQFIQEIEILMKQLKEAYDPKTTRKSVVKAIEILTSDDKQAEEFTTHYRSLRRKFQLLGPEDVDTEQYVKYRWLTAVYIWHTKNVSLDNEYEQYVEKFYDKTVKMIHRSTEIPHLDQDLPELNIDPDLIKQLSASANSPEEKAANMVFALNRYVITEKKRTGISETLLQKVERLLSEWQKRTKDYEKLYTEGLILVEEIQTRKQRQNELGLKDWEFYTLQLLEETSAEDYDFVDDIRELGNKISGYLHPGWIEQPTTKKQTQRAIRKFLRGHITKFGKTLDDLNDLYEKIMGVLETHV